MVVMPDGSEGRTFRVWMESNGYFPVGTKWDESVVNAARALMGRRKKVTSSTGASHAVKTQPAAKKPKPAPAQAAAMHAAPSIGGRRPCSLGRAGRTARTAVHTTHAGVGSAV